MSAPLNQTWNLESFFPGGSDSPELARHLDELEAMIAELEQKASAVGDSAEAWSDLLSLLQAVEGRSIQASSFIGCLMAQNVRDKQAFRLDGRMTQMMAAMQGVLAKLDQQMRSLADDAWQAILADTRMAPVAFVLDERRRLAAQKMDPAREVLAADLGVDGYRAYSPLYDTIVGRITIPVGKAGQAEQLSVGQAYNRFASPHRAERAQLFQRWEEAWGRESDLIAHTLNHLGGYRLSLYRHRGWDSVLQEPLAINRMSAATLDAIWTAAERGKPALRRFLDRKAALLGVAKLDWYDVSAPIGQADRKVGYDEAAGFIADQFRQFSPRMADFAAQAFQQRWIEVEDRPHKMPGGFCTDFPLSQESRIFMTYSGDPGGVSTLAHELGHAYHSHLVFDLPPLVQNYAMNVAETASTFGELIVSSAAIRSAATREEKLALLNDRLGDAVAYLMNIHARFIFERSFYAERAKGLLSVERLNELMLAAQQEAYQGSLGQYHPLFWASKGHFYDTITPFYNFPYTFGYLFSAGIYARALEEGPAFEQRYVDLLRDTGRMTVEELGRRHLGVDLTRPDFWESGLSVALGDVEEFLRLTAE